MATTAANALQQHILLTTVVHLASCGTSAQATSPDWPGAPILKSYAIPVAARRIFQILRANGYS
jgi:hypothetical protein